MSAVITNAQLEPALRYLSEREEAKVAVAAAKFLPAGVKLADFVAAIWAFAKQYNMGKPHFSSTRLATALQASAAAAPAKAPAPAVRAAADRVSRRAAVEKLPPRDSAPNTPPAVAEPFDQDDGSSPWEKRPRRPQARAIAHWRQKLVALANGDKAALEGVSGGAWWTIRKKWFGTPRPSPKMVERFLEWYDALAPDAEPAARAKVPPAATNGTYRTRGIGDLGQYVPETPVAPLSPDGWQEIVPACGGHADYDARYSGTKAKTHRIGFTKRSSARLRGRGFADGKFVKVFWRPKERQLAMILAGPGFKLRAGRDALSLAGHGLAEILGAEPIEFKQLPDVKGFDVVLAAKGGDT